MRELTSKQQQPKMKLMKRIHKAYTSIRIWLKYIDFLHFLRGGDYVLFVPQHLCEECEFELSKCISQGLQKQWIPIIIELELGEDKCCEHVNSTMKYIQQELHLKQPQCVSGTRSSSRDV
jgi:hypothetical protein